VEITKVGQNTRLSEDLGTFNTYEEAKASLFERFDDLFNRPSEYSIRAGKRSPNEKVWDTTQRGREVKASISIIEGDEAEAVLGARVESIETTPKGRKMKSFTIRVPDIGMPTIISVRTLYPAYFKHVSETHSKRMARLKRFRSKK
jgi:hypothetical protein